MNATSTGIETETMTDAAITVTAMTRTETDGETTMTMTETMTIGTGTAIVTASVSGPDQRRSRMEDDGITIEVFVTLSGAVHVRSLVVWQVWNEGYLETLLNGYGYVATVMWITVLVAAAHVAKRKAGSRILLGLADTGTAF